MSLYLIILKKKLLRNLKREREWWVDESWQKCWSHTYSYWRTNWGCISSQRLLKRLKGRRETVFLGPCFRKVSWLNVKFRILFKEELCSLYSIWYCLDNEI
jgi:hypothetical protein